MTKTCAIYSGQVAVVKRLRSIVRANGQRLRSLVAGAVDRMDG
jgi:hypothetical protein